MHCALTPLLITALPAIANHGAETILRRVLILFGIFGVAIGAWVHKSREALLPLSWAMLLALAFELGWVQSAVEVFPSLLLSGCLITAHALNSRACHKKSLCCAADRCDEPFWGLIGPSASEKSTGKAPIVISAAVLLHALVIAFVVHAPVASAASVTPATLATEVQIELAELPVAEPVPAVAASAPGAAVPHAAVPHAAAPAAPPVAAPVAFNQPLTAPAAGPGAGDAAPVRFSSALGAPASSGGALGTAAGGAGHGASGSGGGQAGAPAKSDAAVAVRELSRRPVPPSGLDGLVRTHYPKSLRAQQLEGTGSARLLISPSGVVGTALPSSESSPGFAAACADAMRSTSGWGTPLDREGRPVSTWIHFTCEFSIRH